MLASDKKFSAVLQIKGQKTLYILTTCDGTVALPSLLLQGEERIVYSGYCLYVWLQ